MSVYKPWFSKGEFQTRLSRVQRSLRELKFDGLLAFEPETVTYLTGFFTRGYDSFQFAIIPVQGEPLIVCRDMERFYLENTAVFPNAHFWSDGDNKTAVATRAIKEMVGKNAVLGVELSSWQLTAARFLALQANFPDITFQDASTLVSKQRIIKSFAEIEYQRKAGKIAEVGMVAAIKTAVPGNTERQVAAAICDAMIQAGSDRPGPGVLSSGERAFHLHGGYSDRVIEAGDLVQVETTPNVRYYHARFMRPIKAGRVTDEDRHIVNQLIKIQDKAIDVVGPQCSGKHP